MKRHESCAVGVEVEHLFEASGSEVIVAFGRPCSKEYGAFQLLTQRSPDPDGSVAVVMRTGETIRTDVYSFVDPLSDHAVRESVKGRRVAYCGLAVTHSYVRVVAERLRTYAATWIPADDLVNALLKRQTASSLDEVRQALRDVEDILRSAGEAISSGVSELDLRDRLEARMQTAGFCYPIVYVSTSPPFSTAQDRLIERGDVVSVCLEGATQTGRWSETAVLFEVGDNAGRSPLDEHLDRSLADGIKALRPGTTIGEVASAMQLPSGLAPSVSLGHPVGIDEVLEPVDLTSTQTVEIGQLFALHPSIEHASRSLLLADTVLVGPSGGERLRSGPPRFRVG